MSTLSPSSSDAPLLSIVVPTYNETARIPARVQEIRDFIDRLEYPAELLVVDDGSGDGTPDLVDRLADGHRGIRTIRNDHRGKAYTVRTGMLAATGQYVLFTDADQSTPIEETNNVLPYLQDGWDVVIGSREIAGARRYNEPAFRHIMGRVFTRVVQILTGQRFQDTQCGFKAFSHAAAQDIFSRVQLYGANSRVLNVPKVTGFDVELLFIARKRGWRVREVPVQWYYSAGSKVSSVRDSYQNFLDVVKVRLYDLQGKYDAGSDTREAGR
jgi:glycosyltransferase involved in cell wall biosynthesis